MIFKDKFFLVTQMNLTAKSPILPLTTDLQHAVDRFTPPSPLGFGSVMAPIMAKADYSDGHWSHVELKAYQPLTLDPACKSLHYGQQIFEGMKAYALADGRGALFRPLLNLRRLNESAARMAMPELPEALFMQALESLVYHLQPLIPRGRDESLYLRPLMLATDTGLSLKPATKYTFLVIASPSGAYFSSSKVTALIERQDCRAAPGGTGAYKVAGNYGAAIRADIKAARLGCQQTLWLDAVQKTYVEEFSGMNFFALVDGELWTPPLSDTILGGITRDCVMQIAGTMDIGVKEAPIHINDLIAAIKSGHCLELFACGTAAVVSPVHALAEQDGTVYDLPSLKPVDSISLKLRNYLIAVQTGEKAGPGDWLCPVSSN